MYYITDPHRRYDSSPLEQAVDRANDACNVDDVGPCVDRKISQIQILKLIIVWRCFLVGFVQICQ